MVDTGSQVTVIDPSLPHNSTSSLKGESALSPLRLGVWIADSFLLGDDNPEAIPLYLGSQGYR